MPGINNPYQYQFKPEDNPLSVAQQFGVTPQQLLEANPGGYPFSTGQTIKVPQTFQYNAGTSNDMRGRGYNPAASSYDPAMRGRGANANVSNFDMRSRGYGQPGAIDQLNDMRGRGYGQTNILAPETGVWEDPAATTPTTPEKGQFYGYERDPETGRSVRVIKDSSSASLLNEMRWDPQRRRYVSIGRLLRQGKLDLRGNWHNSSRRQNQSNARQRRQQTQQQDMTLSNSLISFSASAG
jgi:hypothetical protein